MDPSRIVGTAEWYYKRWPKFYNEECYQILADYTAHPEKYLKEQDGVEEHKQSEEEFKDMEESEENKNRKRKVCVCGFDSEQCEHVVSV